MKNLVKFIMDDDEGDDDLYRKAQTSKANLCISVCV